MKPTLNRRRFVKTAAGAAATFCIPRFSTGAAGREKLNVLFIAVDDLNDWIGCLGGHPDSRTPCLDELASRGLLFDRSYTASPLCNPSRAALMTGLRPGRTGVYGNRSPFRMSETGKDAVTLAQHFKNNGYFTTGSNKIFHGSFPDPVSWHTWHPALEKQTTSDPKPHANFGVPETNLEWCPLNVPDEKMGDVEAVDYCISQLKQKQDKPFFLACGIRKPHLPWNVPAKYFKLYDPKKVALPKVKEDDLDDVPPIAKRWAGGAENEKVQKAGKWGEAVAAYLSAIAFVDATVGRLIKALDASDYAKNTIICLWGDHGWHLAEKLHWHKSTLWEEATRAPLIMVAPGVTKPGSRSPRTVDFMHIYPTLVELCGLPPREGLDGVSLLPLLKDPNAQWDRPAITTFMRGNHSVRTERWRYTRYVDGEEELYDHNNDEMEWTNLAKNPIFDGVKKELAKWIPTENRAEAPTVALPGDKVKKGKKLNKKNQPIEGE
ncbi:MAG: sulfatase [Candidatus Sumerlaeia bacterium]|nr:sulfatase [Candidatus Sumerlaeia bacterium]